LEQNFQAFQGKTEEKFNKLENMILQMEQKISQRFDALEKLYKNRNGQASNLKQESAVCFNDQSLSKSSYDFDTDKTTVRLRSEAEVHSCLEIVPQIPKNGQHSYSIKINTETRPFTFGITKKREKKNWNNANCSYWDWTQDGTIRGICGIVSKSLGRNGSFGGQGRILKMVVDMDKGILTFFNDDKQVNSCDISKCEHYFAYISLGAIGDSVTLIQ